MFKNAAVPRVTSSSKVRPWYENDMIHEEAVLMPWEEILATINASAPDQLQPTLVGGCRRGFMEIIRSDDITSFESIYDNINDMLKRKNILKLQVKNEEFTNGFYTKFNRAFLKISYFKHPATLAAMFCARRILEYLCQEFDDDVLQTTDVWSSNIAHALIMGSYLGIAPETVYVKLYELIIGMYSERYQRITLLHLENEDGLRPLELASKLGQFKLLAAILHTSDVYKISENQSGPIVQNTYDFSEYSIDGTRKELSPLRDFLAIREDRLHALRESGLLASPVIDAWVSRVITVVRPSVYIWFLYRIALLVAIFVSTAGSELIFLNMDYIMITGDQRRYNLFSIFGSNITNDDKIHNKLFESLPNLPPGKNESLICIVHDLKEINMQRPGWEVQFYSAYFLMALSGLSIAFDVVDVMVKIWRIMKGRRFMKLAGRKGFVISVAFYRISFFLVLMGFLIFFTIGRELLFGTLNPSLAMIMVPIATIAYGMAKVLTTWSVLYFWQCIPGMGMFVIGFQRMMVALGQFSAVFLIIFLSFSFTFTDILKLDCSKEDFSGYIRGMYSTFLMMLNMVNLVEFQEGQAMYLIQILHVAFVVVVTILLINFLIAVMSHKHTEMTEYGDIIQRLHELDIAITAESRIAVIRRKCPYRRKLNPHIVVLTNVTIKGHHSLVFE